MLRAKPVRAVAEWEKRTHLFKRDEYVCSRCGLSSAVPKCECPKCGARMAKVAYKATWVDEAEMMSAVLDEDW